MSLEHQKLSRATRPLSLIQNNLMTQAGYSPYCGAERCLYSWPRTRFNGEQFVCRCGWKSNFEMKFIQEYKAKWAHEAFNLRLK